MKIFSDLSNEIFFEIFDYIDVLHLFQAFFNLNQRFNLLITNRHICFQANMTKLNSSEFSIYKKLILPKIGCYIRYLSISDENNHLQTILRSISLRNLISVQLYNVKLNELKIILEYCKIKYLFIDTNYIQNEKHLNEIFHNLFNKQSDLYAIECNFHAKLYFLQEKYQISQLKKLIINCECFSSDFLILICQLPKLRQINARINDYNREYMDKDIENLFGNQSIYFVLLHIENVELDRILLILSFMSNVHILELNGSIDFDINYLLEYEKNYTSFRCNLQHYVSY